MVSAFSARRLPSPLVLSITLLAAGAGVTPSALAGPTADDVTELREIRRTLGEIADLLATRVAQADAAFARAEVARLLTLERRRERRVRELESHLVMARSILRSEEASLAELSSERGDAMSLEERAAWEDRVVDWEEDVVEAEERVLRAENELGEARARLRECHAELGEWRATLATALDRRHGTRRTSDE